MLVDREVESDSRQPLIRPIQQYEIAWTLGIAVENVPNVRRDVYVFVQTAIDSKDEAEIADVTTWTSATLQLIEAREVIAFIEMPTVESDQSDAQRIIWSREAVLRTEHQVVPTALAIQTIHKWSIR